MKIYHHKVVNPNFTNIENAIKEVAQELGAEWRLEEIIDRSITTTILVFSKESSDILCRSQEAERRELIKQNYFKDRK